MVATFVPSDRRLQRRQRRAESLQLLEGALSARRVERQAPWLAGLHRASTGMLVGVGLSVLGLSALTLHWQNEWASSYRELAAARGLEHRLQESAAVLEQHHLGLVGRPGALVPTSSANLVHLSEPRPFSRPAPPPLLADLHLRHIPAGF